MNIIKILRTKLLQISISSLEIFISGNAGFNRSYYRISYKEGSALKVTMHFLGIFLADSYCSSPSKILFLECRSEKWLVIGILLNDIFVHVFILLSYQVYIVWNQFFSAFHKDYLICVN